MLDRYDQDLLLDYLEGELEGDRLAQLEAMLKDDPQLATLLEAMAGDRQLLRSLPSEAAPDGLVQDLTQTLERRMLLDDSVDTEPIPIGRGRGLPTEPPKRSGVGRAAGLVGLAASVAIAAGIVVYNTSDPLEETANRLAESTTTAEPGAGELASDSAELAGMDLSEALAGSSPSSSDTASLSAAEEALLSGGTLNEATTDDASLALSPPATDPLVALTAPAQPEPPRRDGPGLALGTDDTARFDADGLADPLAGVPTVNTVALANAVPSQKLVLLTEEPQLSQEQLIVWCVSNGIPIVETGVAFTEPVEAGLPEPALLGEAAFELDADEQPAEPQAMEAGSYALLINDRQLDALITDLNETITVDTRKPGERAALSNQVAIVKDLSTELLKESQTPNRAAARGQHAGRQQPAQPPADSPIELRLPQDLGSPYANTVNRDNLDFEQRRNQTAYRARGSADSKQATAYGQVAQRQALLTKQFERPAQSKTEPRKSAREEANKQPQPPQPEEADASEGLDTKRFTAPTPPAVEDKLEKPVTPQAPFDGGVAADEAAIQPKPTPEPTARQTIDQPIVMPPLAPARGNWLAPHLPLTDTTLILNLPLDDASAQPAQLVPIAIRRAPAEKLRTLRLNQQPAADADLLSREAPEASATDAEGKPEAEADAQPESETEPEPEDDPESSE